MILFGLLNAYLKKPKLVYIWLILFLILGAVGLYDFYMWEYDYGHQLNPNAPIKVPGMTYQPPLIGSKQLLNLDALSSINRNNSCSGFHFAYGVCTLL